MRILHTADWHLGARFHEQARGEEEEHALAALLDLCRQDEVDALLVAGDVFDSANPGADEQRRYYRFLNDVVHQAGVATVVIIGGNHDSPRRLDGPRELLQGLDIYVLGHLGRTEPAQRGVFPLKDRQGQQRATCAAVPYLRDGDLRLATVGESQTQALRHHEAALVARYQEVRDAAAAEGLPVVVMGHCFAARAQAAGEERPIQVGNLAKVDAAQLAGDAAYLALGHIHKPQRLGGRDRWRYCGSLLPMSFREAGQDAQALLVEIADGGEVTVHPRPLPRYREYRRLAGSPETLAEEVAQLPLPKEAPEDGAGTPWCEATVSLEGPRPGLAQQLVDLARERGWALVSVRRQIPAEDAASGEGPPIPQGLQELSPEEVFARRHVEEYGTPPDPELAAEFRLLLQAVTEGSG